MDNIIEQLRRELPPIFAGTSIDELTGNAVCWGTIQNKRCERKIPDECFVRSGTRVLVVRDAFLRWWAATLQPSRTSKVGEAA